MVMMRSSKCLASASRKSCSTQVISIGGRNFPSGKLRQTFGLAADSGELFDVVVPRRDIGVANRPIDGDAVFQIGFEIEIAPAIALAAPGDGLAADLTATNPGKMFSGIAGVGIFRVLDEKFIGEFVARVIALALHVLSFGALLRDCPNCDISAPRPERVRRNLFPE